MTDALQRTVRRCTALLLLPLSLLVAEAHFVLDVTTPAVLTLWGPSLLFIASVLYLAGSFLVSGAGGPAPIDTD
jgi:hypothetical protein